MPETPYVPTAGIRAMLDKLACLTSSASYGEGLGDRERKLNEIGIELTAAKKSYDYQLSRREAILNELKQTRKAIAEILVDLKRIGVPEVAIKERYKEYNAHDIIAWLQVE